MTHSSIGMRRSNISDAEAGRVLGRDISYKTDLLGQETERLTEKCTVAMISNAGAGSYLTMYANRSPIRSGSNIYSGAVVLTASPG